MGLQEIKELLHIKGSHYQNEEKTYRTRENFCKLFIRQRISIQNIMSSSNQTQKKANNPINI
jgi:hypothetical protein